MQLRPVLTALLLFSFAASVSAAVPGDFNNDGRSDVVFRSMQTGEVTTWWMSGSGMLGGVAVIGGAQPLSALNNGTINISFHIAGVADFDQDGFADLLWHDAATGRVVIWKVQNNSVPTFTSVGSVNTAYSIEGIGDFNGDAIPDVFWRDKTTGRWVIWLMNNTFGVASVGAGSVDSNYRMEAVADLDGDGKADLLWHHATGEGRLVAFLMSGGAIQSVLFPGGVNPTYHVEAAGDFNGDGKTDLMWHSGTDGGTVVWLMDATQNPMVRSAAVLTGSPGSRAVSHIEAVGDFDGDGKTDVMWRDATTGAVTAWTMNGLAIRGVTSLPGVGVRRHMEGPTHLWDFGPLPVARDDTGYQATQYRALIVPPPGVLANDTLNGGMILTAGRGDGAFIFTPKSAPTDSFTYSLVNFAGTSTAMVFINVTPAPPCPSISVSTSNGQNPVGKVGTPYSGPSVTASGGTGPYAFAVVDGYGGPVPPGLTINSDGTITGTPTASSDGTLYNPFVMATDANGCNGFTNITFVINP